MAIYNLQPDSRCEYCHALFDPSVYDFWKNNNSTNLRVICKVCAQTNVITNQQAVNSHKCPSCGDK